MYITVLLATLVHQLYIGVVFTMMLTSRGTKVEKLLTLAPERYTAGFHMVAKVILWCI